MSYYDKEKYLTPEAIKKYQKKDTTWLKAKAQENFNKWIRNRDSEDGYFTCISCQKTKRTNTGDYNAGHYYSVKQYNALRFTENNCHGECVSCNYYSKDEHLIPYRDNLIKKIGKGALEELIFKAAMSKRKTKKWDRFALIEVIEKYKL